MRFVDEDDRSVETSDRGEHGQGQERDSREVGPAVVGAEADGDDLGGDSASRQLPDLADGVVLGAAGASGQGVTGGPDERYQVVFPTIHCSGATGRAPHPGGTGVG